ncbi:U32 family peptidase [Candidatus Desantisbacteria bacterium]|nr:U32 family peptidase [Candidatus Desantisbacteria bacterium]
MYKPELVSPAGNYEKLKIAIQYGANAVYLGDTRFSLRSYADNFSPQQIKKAVLYAHERGVKVYLTINIFAHNNNLADIKEYILFLKDSGIDGVIVSDPGVFTIVKDLAPVLPLHISTQANVTNLQSVKFWEKLGASRIILARELGYDEVKEIRESAAIELEVFIHGAMCMAYSGRCMLSSYMVGRDANLGSCAHPCRYKYNLLEEERPGQYFPIEEDEKGTYILSARDLCTIEHIHYFLNIGINSFKIEGRMKGIYYLAVVTRAYRQAIDSYLKDSKNYIVNPEWKEELESISHREYTSGFYFEKDRYNLQTKAESSYIQKYDIVGIVKGKIKDNTERKFIIEIRNKLSRGDEIEILAPSGNLSYKIEKICDINGADLEFAHPNQQVLIEFKGSIEEGNLLRIRKK